MEYFYDRGKYKGMYLVNSGREPKKDPMKPGEKLESSNEPDFAEVVHNLVDPGPKTSIWIGCNNDELKIKIDPPLDKTKKAMLDTAVAAHKTGEKTKIDLDL